MKNVLINRFMGRINIPDNYNIVRDGITRRGDRVFHTEKIFVPVKVGGVDVRNYYTVIRRAQTVHNPAAPKKAVKKAVKRAIKRIKKTIKRKRK